jgi:hypothetical protein
MYSCAYQSGQLQNDAKSHTCMQNIAGFTVTILVYASSNRLNLTVHKNKHTMVEAQKRTQSKRGRNRQTLLNTVQWSWLQILQPSLKNVHSCNQNEQKIITSFKKVMIKYVPCWENSCSRPSLWRITSSISYTTTQRNIGGDWEYMKKHDTCANTTHMCKQISKTQI